MGRAPRVGVVLVSVGVAAATTLDARADTLEPSWQTRRWEWSFALGNDAFTDANPPVDDDGFTSDWAFTIRRATATEQPAPRIFGVAFRHRTLTRTPVDGRRWDHVELFATFDLPYRPWLVLSARSGPAVGGNWGGLYLQNGWHSLSKSGPTIEDGLPTKYDGDRELGLQTGARVEARLGEPIAQLYAVADGQAALGTGISSYEVVGGARGSIVVDRIELGAHVETGIADHHAHDANLALDGLYGTGDTRWLWRVGVRVGWYRFRIDFEYRANEGGSGEPIGVLRFLARR